LTLPAFFTSFGLERMLASDDWYVDDGGDSTYACMASDGSGPPQGLINTMMYDPKTVVRTLLGGALNAGISADTLNLGAEVPDLFTPVRGPYGPVLPTDHLSQQLSAQDADKEELQVSTLLSSDEASRSGESSEPNYIADYGKGWDVSPEAIKTYSNATLEGGMANNPSELAKQAQEEFINQGIVARAHRQLLDMVTSQYSLRQLFGSGDQGGVMSDVGNNYTAPDGYYDPVANANAMSRIDGVLEGNDRLRNLFAGSVGGRDDQLASLGVVMSQYADGLYPGDDGYSMARRLDLYSSGLNELGGSANDSIKVASSDHVGPGPYSSQYPIDFDNSNANNDWSNGLSAPWKQGATSAQVDFVNRVYQAALANQAKTGIPAAITTAQAITESTYGKNVPKDYLTGRSSNNYFGIKARPGEDFVTSGTHEELSDGTREFIHAPFAAYNNLQDSIDAHGQFLQRYGNYRSLFNSTDPITWANGLQAAHYATDSNYARNLIRLMNQWHLM